MFEPILYERNIETLIQFIEDKNVISYKIQPFINFYIRCIEMGFFRKNIHMITEGIESDFKFPKKRISWQRLINVGGTGINIRFREFTKDI